jgi:hypothetical protein
MNERDELRGALSNSVCNASLYTKRAQPYLLGSDMSAVLDKTVDNLLAAGYRKAPEPEYEWGVASKWGSHGYITQALALAQIALHHACFEDARLIKRVAAPAIKPGPWEETA